MQKRANKDSRVINFEKKLEKFKKACSKENKLQQQLTLLWELVDIIDEFHPTKNLDDLCTLESDILHPFWSFFETLPKETQESLGNSKRSDVKVA